MQVGRVKDCGKAAEVVLRKEYAEAEVCRTFYTEEKGVWEAQGWNRSLIWARSLSQVQARDCLLSGYDAEALQSLAWERRELSLAYRVITTLPRCLLHWKRSCALPRCKFIAPDSFVLWAWLTRLTSCTATFGADKMVLESHLRLMGSRRRIEWLFLHLAIFW